MIVALIILGALVVVGAILYVHYRLTGGDRVEQADRPAAADPAPAADSECCGMHITCERDSLLSSVSDDIVYYDDEELDVYRGRSSSEYQDSEIEQFRDILLTLLPEDIAGWARSLQLRQIELPAVVREELLMIVAERRAALT
jgi:hypothetical protein